jgi:hypothetical protein
MHSSVPAKQSTGLLLMTHADPAHDEQVSGMGKHTNAC